MLFELSWVAGLLRAVFQSTPVTFGERFVTNPRITGLLATNIFLSGAAFAAMNPYRAIVGVETLGLSNAAFGLIMALNALGGSAIAVLLG